MNYWRECISEAFDDAKITATAEQINTVASWVEGAHENYGMAMGHDAIPNPLREENGRLSRELKEEQAKVNCRVCGGFGEIRSNGPCHSSISQCWKCRGEGRHSP